MLPLDEIIKRNADPQIYRLNNFPADPPKIRFRFLRNILRRRKEGSDGRLL